MTWDEIEYTLRNISPTNKRIRRRQLKLALGSDGMCACKDGTNKILTLALGEHYVSAYAIWSAITEPETLKWWLNRVFTYRGLAHGDDRRTRLWVVNQAAGWFAPNRPTPSARTRWKQNYCSLLRGQFTWNGDLR